MVKSKCINWGIGLGMFFLACTLFGQSPPNIYEAGTHRLTKAFSPYTFDHNITVRAPDSLIIEAGVEIRLAEGKDIMVSGSIFAHGTAKEPILITPQIPGKPWGTLRMESQNGEARFNHTHINNGVFRIYATLVTMENMRFTSTLPLEPTEALVFIKEGSATIRHCTFQGNLKGEGIVIADIPSGVEVSNNRFFNVPDAIEFINIQNSSITGNLLISGLDDGIDLNFSHHILLENNRIFGFTDRGIEVGSDFHGPCDHIDIRNSVIVNCSTGIGVKEGSKANGELITFHSNKSSIKVLDESNVKLSSAFTCTRSIFSDNNKRHLHVDSLSSLKITHSAFDRNPWTGEGNHEANFNLGNESSFSVQPPEDSAQGSITYPNGSNSPKLLLPVIGILIAYLSAIYWRFPIRP